MIFFMCNRLEIQVFAMLLPPGRLDENITGDYQCLLRFFKFFSYSHTYRKFSALLQWLIV